MLILDKQNFSVRMMNWAHGATSAPKNTFYADFRICLVLEGEAVWEIEDRSYQIRPGDIVFLNIGQRSHFTGFGQKGFKLCTLMLTRNAFSGLHHFMFFLDRAKKQQNVFHNCAFSTILKEISDTWETEHHCRYDLASAKLTEFFIKLERAENYCVTPVTEKDRFMLEAMDRIDDGITCGISLSAIAETAGMSQSAFSRRFSALNGISFQQYVIDKKIQHAIVLLQTTNMKMIDVALNSGFDSISGFYDAFKKRTGTTPSKFCDNGI